VARQDYEAAQTHYLSVVQLQPDDPVGLNNLAWVMHRLKKPGAMAYAEKAVALRPQHPTFLDTLATILADEGDLDKAIKLEKKALEQPPARDEFRLALAKLYLRKGDKALAKAELRGLADVGRSFAGHAEVAELLRAL